jgi:ubiquinone/menaquinone biosynthesis C-methylase UbiE
MLAQARKNLKGLPFITAESIQNMDMRSLTFEAETFHGFTSLTSFMHLPRRTLPVALKEARRILKPHGKGLISISQGDFEGLWAPPQVLLQAYAACWKREQLHTLFEQVGFAICFEQDLGDMLVYVVQKI